jgi:hypothetical protein
MLARDVPNHELLHAQEGCHRKLLRHKDTLNQGKNPTLQLASESKLAALEFFFAKPEEPTDQIPQRKQGL